MRARIPVHLVDMVDPSDEWTVRRFQVAANAALEGIAARGHAALLVGGTGLYLRSVLDRLRFPGRFPEVASSLEADVEDAGAPGSDGRMQVLEALHRRLAVLDPVAAARISPSNRRRLVRALEVTLGSGRPFSSFGPGLERYPPTPVVQLGLDRDPTVLDGRIADRFEEMMDHGFLEEVRSLAAGPDGISRTARQALGYRELLAHVEEGLPVDAAVAEAIRRTRAFARRQRSWFRRDPRIVWMDPDDDDLVGSVSAYFGTAPRVDIRAVATGVGD